MRLASLLLVPLCGCAGLDAAACRQADWYDLGFRDAIYGLRPQDSIYAAQCEPHAVKIDVARYSQGWREGEWEADQRSGGSVD